MNPVALLISVTSPPLPVPDGRTAVQLVDHRVNKVVIDLDAAKR
jgi:hypothetical protein